MRIRESCGRLPGGLGTTVVCVSTGLSGRGRAGRSTGERSSGGDGARLSTAPRRPHRYNSEASPIPSRVCAGCVLREGWPSANDLPSVSLATELLEPLTSGALREQQLLAFRMATGRRSPVLRGSWWVVRIGGGCVGPIRACQPAYVPSPVTETSRGWADGYVGCA